MTLKEIKENLKCFFKDRKPCRESDIIKEKLSELGFLKFEFGKSYPSWAKHNYYPEAHRNPYQKAYDQMMDSSNYDPDIEEKYFECEHKYYGSKWSVLENRRYIVKITEKATGDYIYCGWYGLCEISPRERKWFWGKDIINRGLKNEKDAKAVLEICENTFDRDNYFCEIENCDGIYEIDYD